MADYQLKRDAQRRIDQAPELKAPPSWLEDAVASLRRGLGRGMVEGVPHSLGNIANLLRELPEVPSSYDRRQGVFHEPEPTTLTEDIVGMVIDPSNLIGGTALKPAARAVKKALPTATVIGGTAYAGDTEAGPLIKLYRGLPRVASNGLDAITGLHGTNRSLAGVPIPKANTGKYAWASDNPLVAGSYAHQGGIIIPLETEMPSVILDAKGARWEDYFFPRSRNLNPTQEFFRHNILSKLSKEARDAILTASSDTRDYRKAIKELSPEERRFYFEQNSGTPIVSRLKQGEFKEAFLDPDVKSIMVKNIIDPGNNTAEILMNMEGSAGMQFDNAVSKYMMGNNVLIKDPSVVRYTTTGEPGGWKTGGSVQKFAGGGLALLRKALTGQLAKDAATSNVIKEKGGNWLSGSVEGALSSLKKETPDRTFRAEDVIPRNRALNNFIDKQLTRYVKNEMATPQDPVRALAERGILHVDPDAQYWSNNLVHPSGEHLEKLATAPLAQRWENATDNMLRAPSADNLIKERSVHGVDDWVKNVPRETPIHHPKDNTIATNLGFNHLIDELSNAINPESGLPRHLLLDPKSMERVSVPQAVERVSQINAWRAAQKAEADALRANNAATVLHKEYPEKGMKWVELRKQGMPEGWVQEGSAYANPADPKAKWIYPEESLQDALKYEGDTMGHCVGGYCEDVASGRSRIYSLRDAKGQPHVTIEVGAQPRNIGQQDIPDNYIEEAMEQLGIHEPEAQWGREEEIDRLAGDLWRKDNPDTQRIVQIKGKQNRAPNPEYLPFVQDFVKSGQWSDVGDLQNVGLIHRSTLDGAEIAKARPDQQYFTQSEIDALYDDVRARIAAGEKFASGGSVNKTLTPEAFQAIISAIMEQGAPCAS